MSEQKPSSFNRRKFMINAAKVAGVGASGFIYFRGCKNEESDIAAPPVGKHVFLTKPYLYATQSHRMSVRCITNLLSYCWVEYGDTKNLTQKAVSVSDGLIDAYNRIHEIFLEELKPGKQYYYRIASKQVKTFEQEDLIEYGETIYSEIYSFTTLHPDQKEVSWLVLNDIHDRPESFPLLMKMNGNDPYDFVFLNGDMFNFQIDEEQIIEHLLKPCTEIFATQKPMLFQRGNHEMRGKFAHGLKNYFSYPDGKYFSYQIGPVLMIVLDTGEEEIKSGLDQSDEYRVKQAVWLEKLMQSNEYKQAKYKVVIMHIPPFYSFNQKGSRHCTQVFSPLFDQYKVDLVIAGHTHVYGIHAPVKGKHGYPLVIGGGPLSGERTLIKVKANEQQFSLQMLNDNGKLVGEYIIMANN
jgi:acid phosphatase type 7